MRNTKTYCIYRHIRLDTNEVFYVGMSSSKKRPYCTYYRTKWWKRINNKTDIEVEILIEGLSKSEACELEIFLISEYGRKALKEGSLVNFTKGGEGTYGRIMTQEMKDKISLKNKNSKRTTEQKLKMSKAKIGKYTRGDSPHAKKVINIGNGKVYDSIMDASVDVKYSYDHLKSMLNGRRKNKTNLKYYEQ